MMRIGTGVLIGQFTPGTGGWHNARAKGVGGSEVAAILGLSPWESRFSLWHRKAGLIGASVVENQGMHWGTLLEPVIVDEFARLHPDYWIREPGTYHHIDRPWQIANPDRVLWSQTDPTKAILEVKTAHDDAHWGKDGSTEPDAIPVYYRTQVMWYLDTFGLDLAHIVVLIAGSDYREYTVEYDPEDAAYMRAEAGAFLDSIEREERPSIDSHTATYEAMRGLHPDIDRVDAEISSDLAERYKAALADLKAAKAVKQQTVTEVLDVMGSARRAMCNGEYIALRMARGNGLPYLKAAKESAE